MNKTSISSVVCLDIIDFEKKSADEQSAIKKQFEALLKLAVVDIPEQDRRIVDTGHGAIITCSGALESALEDALFIALTVRDEVLNSNSEGANPIYLLIGINLGSVKVAENANVNEPDQIVGEGLVEAQRIMSFANPNQILVSRAYYDMASKLTLEIAQMFEKYDMHAYEHDIYAVRLLNEKVAAVENTPTIPSDVNAEDAEEVKSGFNWGVYIFPILLAFAMLFALTKWMQSEGDGDQSIEPALTESMMQEVEPEIDGEGAAELVSEDALLDQEVIVEEEAKEDMVGGSNEPVKKATKKKTVKKATNKQSTKSSKEKTKPHQSAVTPEPVEPESVTEVDEKSGWDKFTDNLGQGAADVECSQAQKAMNQCN